MSTPVSNEAVRDALRFCVDCAHSRSVGKIQGVHETPRFEYWCSRSVKSVRDIVTGEPREVGLILCKVEREDYSAVPHVRCGVDGQFWAPKDTSNAD